MLEHPKSVRVGKVPERNLEMNMYFLKAYLSVIRHSYFKSALEIGY